MVNNIKVVREPEIQNIKSPNKTPSANERPIKTPERAKNTSFRQESQKQHLCIPKHKSQPDGKTGDTHRNISAT